jgi:hypothetical protein
MGARRGGTDRDDSIDARYRHETGAYRPRAWGRRQQRAPNAGGVIEPAQRRAPSQDGNQVATVALIAIDGGKAHVTAKFRRRADIARELDGIRQAHAVGKGVNPSAESFVLIQLTNIFIKPRSAIFKPLVMCDK